MTKERLSKLQKWILMTCYYIDGDKIYTVMKKQKILRFFFPKYKVGNWEFPLMSNFRRHIEIKEYNKANATISRSLRNLRDKNYIKLLGHTGRMPKDAIPLIAGMMPGMKTQSEHLKNEPEIMKEEINKLTKFFQETNGGDLIVEITEKGEYYKTKLIELTDKGIEKAKELLKLSSEK